MSDAEKVLDKHRMQDYEDYYTTPADERHYIFTKSGIDELLQAHTNQTLQELKEKVGGQQYDSDWGSEDAEYYRGYNDAIKEVIPLIDEAINE